MTRIVMIGPHHPEYCYLLSRALAELSDVRLFTDQDALNSEYAGRAHPPAPRVEVRHNDLVSPTDLWKLVIEIVRFRPAIIHWQEPSGFRKAFLAAAITTLFKRFTVLALTIHDPVPHAGSDTSIAKRLAALRRYTRKNVHHIFVHGPSCREQYLREYLPAPHRDNRVRLTEHGIILAEEKDAGPPPESFSMLMFGRMEAYKGLEVLCEAMEIFHHEGGEGTLHIAGAGPELDRLEGRFRSLPSVTIANRFLPTTEIIDKIRASDGLVLPYLSATQSGVLSAAFANGRFVIASRIGGIVDVVQDGVNGLLVEPDDAGSLAKALARVSSDRQLRERLRAGATETAHARLDWSKIAAKMITDYKQAAGS
ncbi:glycosyltransferase family 4 protein [Bradyrhizobium sp. URHC0002]